MSSDRKFPEESKLLRKTLNYDSIISKTCQKSDIFFKFSYLTLKEDISCLKEDGRTWPKKEDMSSQRRTYGNPKLDMILESFCAICLTFFIKKSTTVKSKGILSCIKLFPFSVCKKFFRDF
jgi:hypothetical protein